MVFKDVYVRISEFGNGYVSGFRAVKGFCRCDLVRDRGIREVLVRLGGLVLL